MTAHLFDNLVLAAHDEARQRQGDIALLKNEGWRAFHFLKEWRLEEARSLVIEALKAARTPGHHKDRAEITDSLLTKVRADMPQADTEGQSAYRAHELPELERLRALCAEVIGLYRGLQDEAKAKLYDGLKAEDPA